MHGGGKCKKRAEAGRKGGLAKASNAKQTKAKLPDNDTDNDSDNVIDIDNDIVTVTVTDTKQAYAVCDSGSRRTVSAAAKAEPSVSDLFSVKQLMATVKRNKVDLTEEGVHVFYEEMQESKWTLYQKPVEKKSITRALRAWGKHHPEYSTELENDDLEDKEAESKQKQEETSNYMLVEAEEEWTDERLEAWALKKYGRDFKEDEG